MGEEELGAELVEEEELDEVEGLSRGGDSSPPLQEGRSASSSSSSLVAVVSVVRSASSSFMGRGLGLKPNLTLCPPSAPNIAPRTPTYYIPFRDQIVAYTIPPRTEWGG